MALAGGVGVGAVAQQAPIAPSQVTPRNLLPPPPVLPPPLAIPRSLPAEAPRGSDKVKLTVAAIVVDDGYPEMAAKTRALLEPLQGHEVSVGDLYRAAAALEASYVRAGYFLARVVVPEQRVANGATFHFALIDGFVESLQDSGLPWQIRGPVHRKMKGIVGKRKPKLAELDARLAAAGAVPGAKVRSTLGQGEQPGGARLILDGGFPPFGLSIGGDNRLGPSFNNWGLNLSAQINSPTGNGEQFYGFLSVNPRFDLGHDALRRVAGGGLILPITGTGVSINPEFTISDTNPKVGNPIFASNGRLYRGSFSLLAPLTFVHTGALSAKGSLILTDETQSLPFFGIDLSHDRLTVLQGELTGRCSPLPATRSQPI
ncbi:hemolysin activation/secretion protein [Sphingomonas vulcanisoli]|uniref:Hemolysin activation/secretion protein n=1 Tax=Sphingomonas vulcanisoli TaxID=1658060 RepID=A0ABX0TMK7_9SPHN|nr:ShlB/FhaC/HecB family hemolysin secretion/activation protein [Sphingomonas vulcanisoli]NIJ06743.1 hemolysin activation/secretion protein [Sphingomonas vulcanisoli]